MKAIVATALLAVVGLALAGCASGHKTARGRHEIVVTRSAIIAHVKPGTLIGCKGGPSVTIPGGAVRIGSVDAGHWSGSKLPRPASAPNLQLTRAADGTVTVNCTR